LDGEDEVDVRLGRHRRQHRLGVLVERGDDLVGRHQEHVGGHVPGDAQAGRAQERQPLDPLR
jgi:hypothetical protein